jgi:selenocysteine lyase/cysteine desulfurase
MRRLMDGLAAIDGLTLHGVRDPARKTGVVLFTLDGVDPAEVGDRLDAEFGIAVRVGLHCAPQAHRTLGTFPTGGVRMSPGFFNTFEEIDRTIDAMCRIARHRPVMAA